MAGCRFWPAGAAEARILFDVARIGFRAAAQGHIVAGRARAAREAACLRRRALERVTEAAFGQRRKMLRQSLKSLGARSVGAACGSRASSRPPAPRTFRSRASSRSPGLAH